MKKTKKLICLLLLVVIIATALCTVLTACGEKSELKLILGATEKSKNYLSFDAKKGTTYTINISGITGDGSHLLEVNLAKGTATIEVQQTDWNLLKAWNSAENPTLKFNAGTSSKNFTVGASKASQNDVRPTANRCRLLVTVSKDTKIGIELYETLDVKEKIKLGTNTYYYWKSTVQPEGILDENSYRTIVYLGTNAAKELGKVLKDKGVNGAIEKFLTTQESNDVKLKNLEKAINGVTKDANDDMRVNITALISNSLFAVFKWGYNYTSFKKEVQNVANSLAKATEPQCVAFSIKLEGTSHAGYYHIELGNDNKGWMFKTQSTYTLMGAQRHSGAFYNSAGKKI